MVFRALLLLALLAPIPALADTPSAAFDKLLATLSQVERAEMLMSFAEGDRMAYRLTPGSRGGLVMKEMDAATRAATFDFLSVFLTAFGMEVVDSVIDREARLGVIEDRPGYRDPDLYYLAVFGTPSDGRWAFRFEGHHISLNVTLEGDRLVSLTPILLGANPKDLPDGVADPMRPFLDTHEDAADFLGHTARMFNTPDAAALLGGADLNASGFGVWGHPHMEVSSPRNFGN